MKTLLFLVTTAFALPCFAFEMSGLLPPERQRTSGSFSGYSSSPAKIGEQNSAVAFQSAAVSVPLYKTQENAFTLGLQWSQLELQPQQAKYHHFFDQRLSLGYSQMLDQNDFWSLSLRYGSPSDKPFADEDLISFGGTFFYSQKKAEDTRWLWLVDYSNNRPILNNLPLPGFAYVYTPSKEFRLIVGAPFVSLNWEFHPNWVWDFSTLVPWTLKSTLGYKFMPFAKAYTGFDFSQLSYFLADREDSRERLFFDEKKIFVGISSPLAKFAFAEIESGYAFDREFFKSRNYQINPSNATGIGNAFYAKASLRFFF